MRNLFVKLALRSLLRNRVFSFVNIFGLAIGIAVSLLIFHYVERQFSYDTWHANANDIYRVRLDRFSQGELAEQMATAPDALGWTIAGIFPDVKEYVLFSNYQLEGILAYGESGIRLENAWFATAGVFRMFSYRLVKGDPETALSEPFSVVISETMARNYFRDENPLGKMLKLNSRQVFQVTGVFADVPENTHLRFNVLFSMQTMYDTYGDWARNSWWADVMLTYIRLTPGTDYQEFEKKLNGWAHEYLSKELKARNEDVQFHLQPLESIHLYSNFPQEAGVNGDGRSVYFFLVISILILIIAWVNYINLSTARSLERAREVGLRKVSGASRTQLVRQFLIESLVLNLVAVVLALIIVEISYPYFSRLTGLEVNLGLWQKPVFWILFGLVIITGSVLSGLYPAFVLSSFKPITVLKSKNLRGNRGTAFRKILIVFQFSISILLIAGTLAIDRQVKHMKGRDLGVDIGQTMVVRAPVSLDSTWPDRQKGFKAGLLKNPSVSGSCASFFVPGDEVWFTNGYIRKSDNRAKNSRTLSVIHVDHDFVDFYGLQLLAGRNFIEGSEQDNLCHIINRKAAGLLGFQTPEQAIGEELETPNWNMTRKIIGVIENYHQQVPGEEIAPTIYTYFPHPRWNKQYSVRLHGENVAETISFVENLFQDFFPGNTFEYFFLDSHFDKQYNSDREFGKTFAIFALLAIIISVMGLFALSLYFTLQRSREIALRKVMGAAPGNLFMLLSRDFFSLLLVSMLIAFPPAFFIMDAWLDSYAFRIELGMWFFLIPFFIMCLVILLSIGYQIWKTARVNPSDTLRYE